MTKTSIGPNFDSKGGADASFEQTAPLAYALWLLTP